MKRYALATMLAVLCWGSSADAQTYYYNNGTTGYLQNQTYIAPGIIQAGAFSYSPYGNTRQQYYNNYNNGSYGYSNSSYSPYQGYNYNYGYNNGYNNYRPYNSGFSYGNRPYYNNGNYGRSYWRR
jgi:hypothetical protein